MSGEKEHIVRNTDIATPGPEKKTKRVLVERD